MLQEMEGIDLKSFLAKPRSIVEIILSLLCEKRLMCGAQMFAMFLITLMMVRIVVVFKLFSERRKPANSMIL